jgi:GAF domain-containing protein
MPFLAGLGQSLRVREGLAPHELANGDGLERVLDRHLLAVEEMADGILTSILLVDPERKRLWHGSAPNLPQSYCQAIDGMEIGPSAGSCGTAAHHDRAIYVTDIASDPLWMDFRDLALPHGLRACWSTPIRDPEGAIIGTFAIYRRTIGGPTRDEIKAISMITDHVAQAILLARSIQDVERRPSGQARDRHDPKVVHAANLSDADAGALARLMQSVEKLQSLADELDRAAAAESDATAEAMRLTAADCRRAVSAIRDQIENFNPSRSLH